MEMPAVYLLFTTFIHEMDYVLMHHMSSFLLHLPPLLHPFILTDVPCKHLPPPFLQHVGERQCGHNGERLFQQEVDFGFCKAENTHTHTQNS